LTEIEHFIHCAKTGAEPRSNGELGYNVVKVLEMVTQNPTILRHQPELMAEIQK
jgi:hypothetical protein